MKTCCKNCAELDYLDGYFCILGKEMNDGNIKIDYTIDDIDITKCEMFEKRKKAFWKFKDEQF